jgi:hypothetical protein
MPAYLKQVPFIFEHNAMLLGVRSIVICERYRIRMIQSSRNCQSRDSTAISGLASMQSEESRWQNKLHYKYHQQSNV